jgi:hypothetical protein
MALPRNGLALILTVIWLTAFAASVDAGPHSYWDTVGKSGKQPSKPASNGGLKAFDELTKDKVIIEGLFTFYRDTTDNSVLMAIRPEQIEKIYLCGLSLSQGDGAFSEGGRMYYDFPFYFRRVANSILLMEKNLRVRADSTAAMFDAVQDGISDGLVASSAVKSLPQDSTKAILVDPQAFFVRDVRNLAFFLGQAARLGIRFDNANSYFGELKSFPQNTEIDVHLHYQSSQPQAGVALANAYSFFNVFHFSLSTLPESDYVPRLVDDRIGYFTDIYQEYNRVDTETPYVRMINRWHLKKEFPEARISDPVEPIVFWVENTVPEEYRDAIAEGIEMWNMAFEKIGFRNAVVAKIMPDTATWDPADVRYNCVRWLVAKNYPYVAIGPSWSNPLTGQVYAADVGIVADGIRAFYETLERRVRPLTETALGTEEYNPYGDSLPTVDFQHLMAAEPMSMVQEAAFGLSYLQTAADASVADSLTKTFIRSFLTFLVAHEVGHTLGFRHNFMASTAFTLDEINNPEFTKTHSSIGSLMEYPAANVAGPGKTQGEFYPSVPGPYDYWMVEYGYSDFGAKTPEEELPRLQEIASRAAGPGLMYATDEDDFGGSVRALDPRANVWDLGSDPLAFLDHEIALSKDIQTTLVTRFEKPGARYQKVRAVVSSSFSPYYRAATIAPRYVGGLYHNRYHVGDATGQLPYEVVPASEQRRAVAFLKMHVFNPSEFVLSADLLNKMQGETLDDFENTVNTRPTMDYPLHTVALSIQETALSRLYAPVLLNRLVENVNRFKPGEEPYTMHEMFADIRSSIWGDGGMPEATNSFARQMQMSHLARIINIFLSPTLEFPPDARTLASNDLDLIESIAQKARASSALDEMSRAHFKDVERQILAARNAQMQYRDR